MQISPGPLRGPFAAQGRSYRDVPGIYSTRVSPLYTNISRHRRHR